MTAVPYRIYYSAREAAELTGMSLDYVNEALVKGRRQDPPAGAIPAHLQRRFGSAVRIHRSWIFPDEPANVTPLRQTPLTSEQIETVVDTCLHRLLGRIVQASPLHERTA